jgi:hypothetical protein
LGCQTWEGWPYNARLQACMVDGMLDLGVSSISSSYFRFPRLDFSLLTPRAYSFNTIV